MLYFSYFCSLIGKSDNFLSNKGVFRKCLGQQKTTSMEKESLKKAILQLKKDKNAIILGHYYQCEDIQELSDYVGDSLALANEAQRSKKDIIVFCGVHFMAETAKIINPNSKVLLPDMTAGCYLAESCPAETFKKFKEAHPDHLVISYINCTAEIKALSDIICTSGNAEKIVKSLPEEQKIIFAPDKNLGGYINRVTGRNMLLWDGACKVHDALTAESVRRLREQYPTAKVIAHPECNEEVLKESDFVGSTKAMLSYIAKTPCQEFIVATEIGILYEMKKNNPDKRFIVVPTGSNCTECGYMKQNTLENLYECLKSETPEIVMASDLMNNARKPIERMLDMSRQLGII